MDGDFSKVLSQTQTAFSVDDPNSGNLRQKEGQICSQYGDRSGFSNELAFLLSADYPTEFRLMGEELHLSQGL